MGLVYFLLAVVIIGAVVYAVVYYFSQKQIKIIEDLGVKKQKLITVPIADILYTLKNLNLTGQTKRTYETWQATWQTITRFRFPEIEASLVSAEQYIQRMNVLKGSQIAQQTSELIEETKMEVDKIYAALQKLLDSEKKNREELEKLQNRYTQMRKELLAHGFSFGDALESLEKRLSYLELDFTKFNTLTHEGDHLEAKEVLGRIEVEIQDFEKIVEEVPKYLKEIEDDYQDQVLDLKEGYQRMLEEQYQFSNVSIPNEIQRIEEMIAMAKKHITTTELEQARQQLDQVAREIDQLYALMENEIAAKQYVQKNRLQISDRLNQAIQNNRYVNLEVDRLAQNFVLSHQEFHKVQDFAEKLAKQEEAVAYYNKAIEHQQVAYSTVREHYEIVLETVNDIEEQQNTLVSNLIQLTQQEKSIREGLDVFEMDLRNMKRMIEKYHLPGLPKDYLELFFSTSSRIEQLSKILNRVKLDMNEIVQMNKMIEEDVEKLDIMTEQIVDYSQLTEYMIQYANRYRLSHQEVDIAIQESLEQFTHHYRYKDSLAIIERALEQVEPRASQRVRSNYQDEKNNKLFF